MLLLVGVALMSVGCGSPAEIPPGTGKQVLEHDLVREDGREYVMENEEFIELGKQYVYLHVVIRHLYDLFDLLEGFVDRLEWAVNRNRTEPLVDPFIEWQELAAEYKVFVENTDWTYLVSDDHFESAAETVDSIEAFRDANMPILENLPHSVKQRITVGMMLSAYDERPALSLDHGLSAGIRSYRNAAEQYTEGSY